MEEKYGNFTNCHKKKKNADEKKIFCTIFVTLFKELLAF